MEQIASALRHLDAHDRDSWVQMGMAVKSELGEAGFTLWDDWSRTADNYQPKAAMSVWKSIKPGGKVTIASLFAQAIQHGYRPEQPYQAPSAEERAKLEQERADAQAEAEALAAQQRQAAKDKAMALWAKGHDVAAEHPYLAAKGIAPAGVAQLRDMLLVPLRVAGELVNLQIIGADGGKRFLTGGQVKGASLVLGRLKDADTVLMCEGWATGCSLHQATGLPVVVAFNAHNLVAVAERLASILTASVDVLVCGDSDTSLTGQQAASKAAVALYPRGRSVIPVFTTEQVEQCREQHGDKLPSDFNDLHQLAGLDAVLAQAIPVASSPAIQMHGGSIANFKDQDTCSSDQPDSAIPPEQSNIPKPEEEDAYLRYLAELKPLAYGRIRKGAADALRVPVGILDKLVNAERKELATRDEEGGAGGCILFDEVEPWPVDVDAAAVLDAAFALLRQYVIADKETLRAAALWAAMTWFVDYATVLPLAVITAPEKGCGKSTLLQAVAKLSCRPLSASNITPAALFRAVEAWKPTLMIDEADTFAKDNEELRGVLNAGHTRDTATVVRVVEIGGELQPRAFSVWGAKALAGIGNMPETIMSRAVVLNMRRKTAGERADNLRHADAQAFHLVKRQLARWADDMGETFAASRPDVGSLNNRTADNWEPLLALADLAGGEWPKLARQAAGKLTGGEEEAPSMNEELLRDIRTAFDQRKATKLWTSDLIDALCQDEEAPWSTYNFRQGKPITARQLSKRLGEFGIKPKDIKEHFEVRKGYRLEDFADAFTRYLDGGGNLSATPLPANNDGAFRVADSDFTGQGKSVSATSKPAPNKEGSGVADRTPGSGKQSEGNDDAEYF
ncbi:DUF3631 domain-containing protein [Aquitalea denitrificans]|uniref:DUF3631 domain-containing protein n=1 Tax=Aquitalea denitrificans TaxID=519081 RepID=UPI00135A47E2|nr:DUF3631 domain-containing protein [Aquitalea denitrificans]